MAPEAHLRGTERARGTPEKRRAPTRPSGLTHVGLHERRLRTKIALAMERRHSIRFEVADLAQKVAEDCRRALPRGECVLVGEVLDVWRRGDRWEITLADIKEDDLAFSARLSATEPRPPEGYTIALVGHYEVELDPVDASLCLVFEANRRDPTWSPREPVRRRARRELIEQLKERLPRAPLRKEPRRVTLVTSRGSTASEDFKAGLRSMASEVSVEIVPIPLEEGAPSDIAAGIRRAGEKNADLVVIARGGGRKIMLQRFSHEEVVTAVAEVAARVPVLVAVGHARDRIDAEQFAWQRAFTPSDAGARVASEIRIRRAQDARRMNAAPTSPAPLQSAPAVDVPSSPAPWQMGTAWATSGRPRQTPRPSRRHTGYTGFLLLVAAIVAVTYAGWSVTKRLRGREGAGGAIPAAESVQPPPGKGARPRRDDPTRQHRRSTHGSSKRTSESESEPGSSSDASP